MILSIIAAIGENNEIGCGNTLPWRLPADLKRFKELTTGHPVVMGRNTFESLFSPTAAMIDKIIWIIMNYD